eukprot:g4073.t1
MKKTENRSDDAPLEDLQRRLNRLKALVPQQYKRTSKNATRRRQTRHERWAKRVSRRMELEETYNDDSERSACSINEMMEMLNHAEAISTALNQDLRKERPNIHNLTKINLEQKQLLRRIYRRQETNVDNNDNKICNTGSTSYGYNYHESSLLSNVDNDSVPSSRNSNVIIQHGINRILNSQQDVNEAIGRLENTRLNIQSYLHNVYNSADDNHNLYNESNSRLNLILRNSLPLSNDSFCKLSTWN